MEEGDVIREYKSMQEGNFLSSWSRCDLTGKEGKVRNHGEEEENKRKRNEEQERDGEREEDETVERRCVSSNLAEAFDIFSQGEE